MEHTTQLEGWVEGEDNLPPPAVSAILNSAQSTIGIIGHKGTLLAHGQLVVYQDPRSFSGELLSIRRAPSLY